MKVHVNNTDVCVCVGVCGCVLLQFSNIISSTCAELPTGLTRWLFHQAQMCLNKPGERVIGQDRGRVPLHGLAGKK